MRKTVWRSAVARMLEQQHRNRQVPNTVRDGLIALSQKGFTAPECVAQLARKFTQCHSANQRPRDLEALGAKLGLTVKYRPLALEAILQQTDSGFQAVISSTLTPSQQRLALAHEIGHVVLYQATGLTQSFGHVPLTERISWHSTEIEKLCDFFATELVMPAEEWADFIEAEGLSLSTLNKLSDAYGVALEQCAERIVEVTTVECAVILWDVIAEGGEVTYLQPRSIWSKNNLPRDFLKQRLERSNDEVKPGSPFHAWDTRSESAGRISLSMKGLVGSFLAQSNVTQFGGIYTLIVPVRLGWEKMFRKKALVQ